jgi:hypothetical protein
MMQLSQEDVTMRQLTFPQRAWLVELTFHAIEEALAATVPEANPITYARLENFLIGLRRQWESELPVDAVLSAIGYWLNDHAYTPAQIAAMVRGDS